MNERLISEALDKAIILRLPPEAYADITNRSSNDARSATPAAGNESGNEPTGQLLSATARYV